MAHFKKSVNNNTAQLSVEQESIRLGILFFFLRLLVCIWVIGELEPIAHECGREAHNVPNGSPVKSKAHIE